MNKNLFFDEILSKRFSSDINEAIQKDFSSFLNNNKQDNAPHIDSLFEFYFDELNFTSEQFLYYSNISNFNKNVISELLTKTTSVFIKNREQWIERFTDSFYNNFSFFKETFVNLININDDTIKGYNNNNNQFLEYIKKNRDFLDFLIKIGKEKNHFSKFSENDFFVKNQEIQDLLKKENIINSSFTIKKLITHVKSSKNNNFISNFYKDIISLDKKELHSFLETIKDISYQENTNLIDEFLNQLLNQFPNDILIYKKPTDILTMEEVKKLKKEREENIDYIQTVQFFKNVMDYDFISPYFINSKHLDKLLLNFPTVFNYFLHKAEFSFDYQVHKQNYDFNDYIKKQSILNAFIAFNKVPNAQFDQEMRDSLSSLIKIATSHIKPGTYYAYGQDKEELINKTPQITISLFLASYVSKYISFLPKNMDDSILNDFLKTQKLIIRDGLHIEEPEYLLSNKFLLIKHYQKILDDDEKLIFNNQINLDIKNFLLEAISPNTYIHKQKKLLNLVSYYIREFGNTDILDVLNNKNWTELFVSNTHKDFVPLSFYMIKKSEGVTADWFLQKNNIEDFLKIKYKNKTFVNQFKDQPYFYNIFMQIFEHKDIFQKLFIKNKTNYNLIQSGKLLSTSENNHFNMMKMIDYQILSNKLPEEKRIPKKTIKL